MYPQNTSTIMTMHQPQNATLADVLANASKNGTPGFTDEFLYGQERLAKHIGMIIISVMAIIGNGLLIITVARNKHLQTTTNAFVVSLATADFLFGFPTIPMHLMAERAEGRVLGIPLSVMCLVAMSMTAFQLIITLTTLLLLTLERYMSILYPLKHRIWSQRRHVATLLTIVWLYCIFVGFLPLTGWNTLQYYNPWDIANSTDHNITATSQQHVPRCSFIVINTGPYMGLIFMFHAVPVCFMLPFFYARMFITIRRFVARKASQSSFENGQHRNSAENYTIQEQHQKLLRRSNRRSLRLLVVMAVYGVFSWLPTTLWYCVATHGFTRPYITAEMLENVPIPIAYYQFATILGFANSAINPYIYGFGNVPIRSAFFRMFQNGKFLGFQCRKRQSEILEYYSAHIDLNERMNSYLLLNRANGASRHNSTSEIIMYNKRNMSPHTI